MSREEPLLLITYTFVDDLAEDGRLGLEKCEISLSPTAVLSKYETIRRRLDGRSKGLVEIVNYKSAGNVFEQFRVDFLHRTVRDYLYRSDNVRSFILKQLGPEKHLWARAYHAALLTLKVLSAEKDSQMLEETWDEIFNFAYLSSHGCHNPLVVDQILDEAENVPVRSVDFTKRLSLACEYGLLNYIRRKISERYDGDCLLEGSRYTTTNIIIIFYNALTPNRISGELSPGLVSYILSSGCNINKASEAPKTNKSAKGTRNTSSDLDTWTQARGADIHQPSSPLRTYHTDRRTRNMSALKRYQDIIATSEVKETAWPPEEVTPDGPPIFTKFLRR
jgi:hypothetical protein